MKKWLRRLAWILAAPVVWIAGCVLLCVSPITYEVERTPVMGLPARPVTVEEVSALNRELENCNRNGWYLSWSVRLYCEEYYLAVPTASGGLELVHAYPALVWGHNTQPEETPEAVVQKWLAKLNNEGGTTP